MDTLWVNYLRLSTYYDFYNWQLILCIVLIKTFAAIFHFVSKFGFLFPIAPKNNFNDTSLTESNYLTIVLGYIIVWIQYAVKVCYFVFDAVSNSATLQEIEYLVWYNFMAPIRRLYKEYFFRTVKFVGQ